MKSGGIVSRLSGDVDAVSGLVQMALISPGVATIRVVLTTVILFALSQRLAVAASVMLPPMAARSAFCGCGGCGQSTVRCGRTTRTSTPAWARRSAASVSSAPPRKREQGLRTGPPHHHPQALWAERMELALSAVWGLLIPGTSLLIVWYGGRLHLRGQADVGDIFAFQIYALLLLQPVFQIVSSVSQTQKSLAAMERVFEVLEMPPDKPDAPDAVDAPRQVREIRFEHVDFEYRPGVRVIRDFDLVVPGGATVALVGPAAPARPR